MNNNLAKTNETDFTVLDTGEAYASQRAVAALCGMAQQTINDFFRSKNTNVKQGVSPEYLQKAVTHYAQKGKPEAINSLSILAEAGAKAFIYNQAGLKLKTESSGNPLDIMQQSLDILRAQEEKLENHEDRLTDLENYKYMRSNNKAGSYVCSDDYITVGNMEKALLQMGKPVSNPTLRKFVSFYESEIRREGQHCFHKDDVGRVIRDVWDRCVASGAYVQDPQSGFKFKADWLLKDLV